MHFDKPVHYVHKTINSRYKNIQAFSKQEQQVYSVSSLESFM